MTDPIMDIYNKAIWEMLARAYRDRQDVPPMSEARLVVKQSPPRIKPDIAARAAKQ